VKFLNAQLAAAKAHKLELQNSLNAADENSKRLEQRLEALNHQVTVKYDESVRSLRLPKERQTDKSVGYVIVQYGSVYPCRNPDLRACLKNHAHAIKPVCAA
jgi:formiminotetrahydrofolate cyclodeaminase